MSLWGILQKHHFLFSQLRINDGNKDLNLKLIQDNLEVVEYEEIMDWIKELYSSEETAGG